jgi:hypothetical protein
MRDAVAATKCDSLNLKAVIEKSAVNPTPGWIGRAALAELLKRVPDGA